MAAQRGKLFSKTSKYFTALILQATKTIGALMQYVQQDYTLTELLPISTIKKAGTDAKSFQ